MHIIYIYSKAVKDYMLVTMVGVFVILESVYLGVWEIKPLIATWESRPVQVGQNNSNDVNFNLFLDRITYLFSMGEF